MNNTNWKHALMITCSFLMAIISKAQNDTSHIAKQDTIRIGNMIIVGGKQDTKNNQGQSINVTIIGKNKKYKGNNVNIMNTHDTLIAITEDTVKVGRLNIIKSQDDMHKKDWQDMIEDGDFRNTKIKVEKAVRVSRPQRLSNWWIFDIGFANYYDATSYADPSFTQPLKGGPLTAKSFSLNNTKSSNVNIWIVQKKVPIAKERWFFKYGIGWQMYNFRFDQPISYRNEGPAYVYLDSKTFSKDKLYVNYLSVPLMINYTSYDHRGINISAGLNVGYLVGSRNKQIAENKMKYAGKFNLNDFQVAGTGELGIGSVKLYGTVSLTNLYNKELTKQFNYPFAVGVRFSRF